MKVPFSGPALGNIMQVAWVTPDMDATIEQFRTMYRVPEFMVMEQSFPAEAFGEKGEMSLRIALANVDNMQLELIQPLGGGVDRIYRDVLPRDGSHANIFHHICVRIEGSLEDWDAYISALGPDRPVVYTGDVGPGCRFVYTDERSVIGMYVEHVWFSAETAASMAASVPTYHTV